MGLATGGAERGSPPETKVLESMPVSLSAQGGVSSTPLWALYSRCLADEVDGIAMDIDVCHIFHQLKDRTLPNFKIYQN